MLRTKQFMIAATVFFATPTFGAHKDVISKDFDLKPGGKLTMNVDRGSIRISPASSDRVSITVTRELTRGSEKKAREAFDLHRVEIEQTGAGVRVFSEKPNRFRSWRNPLNNMRVEY